MFLFVPRNIYSKRVIKMVENRHQLETGTIKKVKWKKKKNDGWHLQFNNRRLKITRQNMADMLSVLIRQCSQSFCSSIFMAKEFLLLCVSRVRNKRQNERKLETGTIIICNMEEEKV
jgi:hypothetical protein